MRSNRFSICLIGVSFLMAGLFFAGCNDEDDIDVESNVQNAAVDTTLLVSDLMSDAGKNFETFTWYTYDNAYYENGWWHVDYAVSVPDRGEGSLHIRVNFRNNQGENMQYPTILTTRMETISDFDATFQRWQSSQDADHVYTREVGGTVITATGNGQTFFDSSNVTLTTTYTISNLFMDVADPNAYPNGTIRGLIDGEHIGEWTYTMSFNGTMTATIVVTDGSTTFTILVNLDTGHFTVTTT